MEKEDYESARRAIESKRGFYIHIFVYIFVNLGIFALDAMTGTGLWFQWTLIGWGMGLVGHAFSVFVVQRVFSREWEDAQIKKHVIKKGKK